MREFMDLQDFQYPLFWLEIVIVSISIIATPYLLYILLSSRVFHVNFRMILFECVICIFISYFLRVYQTLAVIDIVRHIAFVDMVLSYSYMISSAYRYSFVILVLERSIATQKKTVYEHTCSNGHVLVCIIIPLMLSPFTWGCIKWFPTIKNGIVIGAFAMPPILILPMVIFLHCRNSRNNRSRLEKDYNLSSKYQVNENLRSSQIILPISVNTTCCMFIYLGLLFYSAIFTAIPLGSDDGPITHVYHFIDIHEKSFFIFYIIWSLKKKSILKATNVVKQFSGENEADYYFTTLASQWAKPLDEKQQKRLEPYYEMPHHSHSNLSQTIPRSGA